MLSTLHIHIMSFPENERMPIRHITELLMTIESLVMDIKTDFQLKKDTKLRLDEIHLAKRVLQRSYLPGMPTQEQVWQERELKKQLDEIYLILRIPFRDAAMNLHQLSKLVTNTLRAEVNKVENFASVINKASLGRASDTLRDAFPDAPALRNSMAHAGEIFATMEKSEKTCAGGIGGVTIIGGFSGDEFFSTIGGQMRTISLVDETVSALDDVLTHLRNAFEPATVNYRREIIKEIDCDDSY